MIVYLDKHIRSLVLIMSEKSRYVKMFKVKKGDKDKNNKLISFGVDNEKLLKKFESYLD